MRKTLLSIFCLAVLSVAANAQGFKNLAGSADEMKEMRLPAAESLGTRSKTAMLPVKFRNGEWSADIPIETTNDLKISILAPNSRSWEIKTVNESGEMNLRRANVFIERSDGEIGLDGVKYPAEIFSFDYAKGGNWRVQITSSKPNAERDGDIAGYLVISNKTPYHLYTSMDTLQTLIGRRIGIRTSVFENDENVSSRVPESIRGSIETARAEILLPDGERQSVNLRDSGDGIFTADFVPRNAGRHALQVTVVGKNAAGESFIRTSEQVLQVLNETVFFGKAAYANLIDDHRLQINLAARGLKYNRKVIAYAEVWGRNAAGVDVPVSWISGMTFADRKSRGNASLIFDTRWLARSEAVSDFQLRNIRLQDPDYFVTLAETQKISLTIPILPEKSNIESADEITNEMRMGKRPEIAMPEAVGGKLMLVHGYCAGSAPFPSWQFSDAIVLTDFNQNRTHDQFANIIKNFGAAYPSFGIVAHSQGGAASLHLYTYYWSGLDYATGNRLIQSVGTPYQGTALAGNLAALGSVFGAGCGSNQNLTYSGAAAWLANIPAWARAKVHYSTTSFTDVWYRYDYCNAGTDLFLNDPDDGVVERDYAQLPGANNRGHKTGWCHTNSMRDPGQTTDSVRNADMNANAAR